MDCPLLSLVMLLNHLWAGIFLPVCSKLRLNSCGVLTQIWSGPPKFTASVIICPGHKQRPAWRTLARLRVPACAFLWASACAPQVLGARRGSTNPQWAPHDFSCQPDSTGVYLQDHRRQQRELWVRAVPWAHTCSCKLTFHTSQWRQYFSFIVV